MLRFLTAGESHGLTEVAILEGIPAGLELTTHDIQLELEKRRGGMGRGERGKIETDKVEIIAGIRFGKTIGSPIALLVKNLDYDNWKNKKDTLVTNPRPGHADLPGVLKYGFSDVRNVLERASARETVMRVAVGAVCKKLLSKFCIKISSRIIQIGKVQWFKSLDYKEMEKVILEATKRKDTLGGVIEVNAYNVPPGLGSYVQWDKRLDGKLAQALMSIPSVKAVEVGDGIVSSTKFGSEVQDEIYYKSGYFRKTNHAGGIEGGVTNGEDIICRVYHKPLSTVGNSLNSVDIKTKLPTKAVNERSDICAIPRAGVISEAMLGFILADAVLEKFGGDNIEETQKNFKSYLSNV